MGAAPRPYPTKTTNPLPVPDSNLGLVWLRYNRLLTLQSPRSRGSGKSRGRSHWAWHELARQNWPLSSPGDCFDCSKVCRSLKPKQHQPRPQNRVRSKVTVANFWLRLGML